MKTVQINEQTKHILISERSWGTIWAEVNETKVGILVTLHKEGSIGNPNHHETVSINSDDLKELVKEL